MLGLSRSFYETAYELTAAMTRGEAAQVVKNPSAVIVLVTSCLEAYLSEFLALFRELEPDKWETAISRLDRKDPRTRWIETPQIFTSRTFDTASEPFQSFHALICLRNSLVHYSPRFRTPTEFPSKTIRALNTKFAFSHEGNTDWTAQVLNLECARWGCRTAKAMIRRLHELAGGTDMSGWPHPWPDPP
jgi:hypothetical protein